jgi:cyclic pyranopterin phosphate synthase
MAAKKTDQTIPLCHAVALTSIQLAFDWIEPDAIRIEAVAEALDRTGVEMEALLAVSVAALTIYDMCKSVDRTMTIQHIRLEEKAGGRSGHFVRADDSVVSVDKHADGEGRNRDPNGK